MNTNLSFPGIAARQPRDAGSQRNGSAGSVFLPVLVALVACCTPVVRPASGQELPMPEELPPTKIAGGVAITIIGIEAATTWAGQEFLVFGNEPNRRPDEAAEDEVFVVVRFRVVSEKKGARIPLLKGSILADRGRSYQSIFLPEFMRSYREGPGNENGRAGFVSLTRSSASIKLPPDGWVDRVLCAAFRVKNDVVVRGVTISGISFDFVQPYVEPTAPFGVYRSATGDLEVPVMSLRFGKKLPDVHRDNSAGRKQLQIRLLNARVPSADVLLVRFSVRKGTAEFMKSRLVDEKGVSYPNLGERNYALRPGQRDLDLDLRDPGEREYGISADSGDRLLVFDLPPGLVGLKIEGIEQWVKDGRMLAKHPVSIDITKIRSAK